MRKVALGTLVALCLFAYLTTAPGSTSSRSSPHESCEDSL
jgi:hypothetical protein